MKVEIHLNGCMNIELKPEDEIQSLVLARMAEGAKSGKKVTLEAKDDRVVVSVEK